MKRLATMLMAIALMPLMALATTYYVNGTTGSDSYSGLYSSSPKKTIQAAIDAAADGDTILVAPGTYKPIVCIGKTLRIESVSGKGATIIDGNSTTRCVKLANQRGYFGPPSESSGVYGSTLVGFTLKNGTSEYDEDEGCGGGVFGGTIENCVIENCWGYGGGGAGCAKLYNCVIRNNIGGDDGGGCWECMVYNSLITGNRSNNSCGGGAGSAATCSKLYNCTITKNVAVEDNCSSAGALDYYISAYNCIVCGNVTDSGKTANITSAWGEYYGDNLNNYTDDPHFVDAANGDYRLASDSPCIDVGDNSYVTGDTDLDGNARIVNSTVDIGCYEYGPSPSVADGLVAWYKFDGNANDSSGNGNDGVVHGATLTTDRNGNANSAYYFDGDDDYIRVPCSQGLDNVRTAITLAAWIRPDEWSDETRYTIAPIFSKGTDSNRQWGFSIQSGSVYELSDPIWIQCSQQVKLGRWQFVVVTYDGQIAHAYLDGEEIGSLAKSAVDYNDALGSDLLLGVDPQSWMKEFLKGALDDLRIYNRALSAAEVKALYGETDDGLVAWYKFDGNANDSSGNGNNGVVHGATLTTDRFGNANSAYLFGGYDSANYIEVSSSESLNSPVSCMTISAWVRPDAIEYPGGSYGRYTSDQWIATVVCKGSWSRQYGMQIEVNSGTRWLFSDYAGNINTSTHSLLLGAWQHVVLTDDGATIKAYVNGVLVGSEASDGSISSSSASLYIGKDPPGDMEYFNGAMDDIRIYNRALSAAEVSAIYNEGGSVPTIYHTVTFNANGGTSDEASRRIEDGAEVGTLPIPSRTGYAFAGWFTAAVGGARVLPGTVITADVTYYAQWTPNEYTIAFDGNGSTGGATWGISAAYGADVTLSANGFTKTGYSFAGWSTRNWGGAQYSDRATVSNLTSENGATVTLYAVWSAIDYTVTFNGNGADWGSMSSQWMTYDSWENLNSNQYGKTGYTFSGWATTAGGSVVYENGASVVNLASTAGASVGLYAKWTVNRYTINFNANGGSTDMSSVTRNYGTAIGTMTDAWRTGYDFVGWFTSASGGSQVTAKTTVSGNATLYAHWQLKTCTVTVDANGGDAIPSFTRQHGSTIGSLPIPTRVGHIFKGWFTAPDGGDRVGVSQVVTGDLALYAHWTTYAQEIAEAMPDTGNVRYSTDDDTPWTRDASVSSDGESIRSYPVSAGGESAIETQVYGPGNFMFDWRVSSARGVGVLSYYVDGVKKKEITGSVDWRTVDIEISGSGTHTIRWVYSKSGSDVSGQDCGWIDAISWSGASFPVVSYTVSFNVNGGDTSVPSVTRESGTAIGSLPTPTRANATFLGWFTAATGGSKVASSTVVTANLTLYAHWQVSETPPTATSTVTFNANGGTCATKSTTVNTGAAISTLPVPTRTGYGFAGWFTAQSGGARVNDGVIVSANATWYAHWTANAYTITYLDTRGATNPNPATYTVADAVTFEALANVDGYRFAGWSQTGIARGSTGAVTVSAIWETVSIVVPDDTEPMDAGVANTYDGVIMDADGLPVGYIAIKAGKINRSGISKVTATIQMVGETKKVSVKADVVVEEAVLNKTEGGKTLDLMFTHDGFTGTYDGYEIEGVRNLLSSNAKTDKGTAAKLAAEAAFNSIKGNYVMAYCDDNGWNGLSVSIMSKGKVKVSGKLANGKSITTSSQLIVGSDYSCAPVIYSKSGASLAFSIYFANDGTETLVFGDYEAAISKVGALKSGCVFDVGEEIYDLFDGYELQEDLLPSGVSVEPNGNKLVVAGGAKAGKVKLVDGDVVDTSDSDNSSGLKLTFTAKSGSFKGSFKVYALDEKGKLKTFNATVSGVVVDGYGYGVATIRGRGSISVYIN